MKKRTDTKSMNLFRWVSIATAAALFVVIFTMAIPLSVKAQTTSPDYLLYGVNLVGTPPMMNPESKTITSGQMKTPDSRLILNIPAGTFIRNAAGLPQAFISATQVTALPGVPTQQKLLFAFDLGTPGATFNPTVGLTLSYFEIALPQGASDGSLYIASWNGTDWTRLSSDVNASAKTVSTTISSFTTYALMAGIQPPVTTTLPSTTPSTAQTNPVSTSQVVTTSGSSSSNISRNSVSPIFFVIGGGAIFLVIALFLVSRKK